MEYPVQISQRYKNNCLTRGKISFMLLQTLTLGSSLFGIKYSKSL